MKRTMELDELRVGLKGLGYTIKVYSSASGKLGKICLLNGKEVDINRQSSVNLEVTEYIKKVRTAFIIKDYDGSTINLG